MTYFAVVREAGAAWLRGGVGAQPAVEEHAVFMSTLQEEGFVLGGGPLAGSEGDRLRALLIVEAESEADVRRRLAADPWAERLTTVSVEPWNLLLGAERFA